MRLRFITDATRNYRGFWVALRAVCGGYLTDRQAILTSPNYPENYPRRTDCEWIVKARPGREIGYEFLNLDMRSDDVQCGQDYLMVIV